jgi:hypothetical protein
MAVGEAQHAVQFVVMLVEGAAGGDESESHIGLMKVYQCSEKRSFMIAANGYDSVCDCARIVRIG